MVSCRLKGGLGNQMFQIAATYSLSKELNTNFSFDFDDCYTPNQGFVSNKYKENIFKNIPNSKINFVGMGRYLEPSFGYSKITCEDNTIIDGYFQSEKYFDSYEKEIKNLFYFDEDIKNKVKTYLDDIKKNKKITTIHVRRGDYLKNPYYHSICPLEYYVSSMKSIENSVFLFLSDDLNWCKENFVGKDIYFSEFDSEIMDFYSMTQSDNNIISNSSFSWWGSYLNETNGITIAPKEWFGPLGPKDVKDLYNKNWIIF